MRGRGALARSSERRSNPTGTMAGVVGFPRSNRDVAKSRGLWTRRIGSEEAGRGLTVGSHRILCDEGRWSKVHRRVTDAIFKETLLQFQESGEWGLALQHTNDACTLLNRSAPFLERIQTDATSPGVCTSRVYQNGYPRSSHNSC